MGKKTKEILEIFSNIQPEGGESLIDFYTI
jgi:hypothetical protein